MGRRQATTEPHQRPLHRQGPLPSPRWSDPLLREQPRTRRRRLRHLDEQTRQCGFPVRRRRLERGHQPGRSPQHLWGRTWTGDFGRRTHRLFLQPQTRHPRPGHPHLAFAGIPPPPRFRGGQGTARTGRRHGGHARGAGAPLRPEPPCPDHRFGRRRRLCRDRGPLRTGRCAPRGQGGRRGLQCGAGRGPRGRRPRIGDGRPDPPVGRGKRRCL